MTSWINALSAAAHHSPSPDNSQPWQLIWKNNTLRVSYDAQRVAHKTFTADSHATLLTMGALSENFTQAATALNIPLDWSFPKTLDARNPVYFEFKIAKTPTNSLSKPDLPLFKRHTNRHPYRRQPLPDSLLSLVEDMTQSNTRILIFTDKSSIHQAAQLIRLASEIRFQTQDLHEWLGKSFRFNTQRNAIHGEGLDVNTLDLPPGGKLFLRLISDWQRMRWLNKLGAYKALAFIDAQPISQAPALLAVIGPDSFRDTLAAGQLLERAWIALNQQNIAVHPYYVVADQLQRRTTNSTPVKLIKQADEVFAKSQELFQLNAGETLHMLFRIGYPKKTPVLSKRLPLEEVCSLDP